jgi:hypothetical protein
VDNIAHFIHFRTTSTDAPRDKLLIAVSEIVQLRLPRTTPRIVAHVIIE